MSSKFRRLFSAVLGLILFAFLLISPWSRPLYAATFIVNSTGDGADANPGDGVCETATPGECTLRAAIQEANALAGTDTIHFNIPGAGVHTITPASALPGITQSVLIDGSTQPGASCATWPPTLLIELNGTTAGSSAFDIGFAASATIRGLVINNFSIGIHIANSSNNVIQCNFLGTDPTGTVAQGMSSSGVFIQQDSNNNLIGGAAANLGNLISANGTAQIYLSNFGSPPNNNIIQNNYIGPDVTGSIALGGGDFAGIYIFGGNGTSILDNLISGNSNDGISLSGDGTRPTNGTIIQGNLIGTDQSGTIAVGNGSGVALGSGGNNNVHHTIIGTDGDGVNDAAEGNVISGNHNAIVMFDSTNNVVAGNYIGTDVSGTLPLGNMSETIVLFASSNNRIGTNGDGVSDTLERNLVADSGAEAIWIIVGSHSNVIAGNYIGTDVTGTIAFGSGEGIFIMDSDNNRIGTDGSDDAFNGNERNLISGNHTGVRLYNAHHTIIAGNYIGTDATGTMPLGNLTGIHIYDGSTNNRIGTNGDGMADALEANLISGNLGNGIELDPFNVSSIGNSIRGNSIYGNGLLGIDLDNDGVTLNDPDDADSGSNNLQNYPILLPTVVGGNLVVDYTLDSAMANTAYPVTIDLFKADSVLSGQGQVYLGSGMLDAPGLGSVDLGDAAALGIAPGDPIVATATDANGNTSEFSPVSITAITGLTLIVNSTADAVDANPGDGFCETAVPGECTLRAAIEEANALAGDNIINFSIPGAGVQTIPLTSQLPWVSQSLTIDGLSQPGADCSAWPPTLQIEINAADSGGWGLLVSGGSLTMSGIILNGYTVDGVFLDGGSSGHRFECNFLGTNSSGTATVGNGQAAIFANGANNNIIGGLEPHQRNLIAGNHSFEQLRLAGSDGNVVRGNYIGTNVDGTAVLGSSNRAILITGNNNLIGGTAGTSPGGACTGACNVIAGSTTYQIWISAPGISNNVVQGNHIGVNAAGTGPLGAAWVNVQIDSGSTNTLIGGDTPEARNVIGGGHLPGLL